MKSVAQFRFKNHLSLCLSLVCLLILSSCLNDIEDVISTEERPDPAFLENYSPVIRPVTGSVVVFVVDENGDPVPGADVSLGTNSGITDDFGHFFINDVELNARGSLVQINKDGYFDGSRRFFPLDGEKSYVKIELIDRIFSYSFTAGSGGTINLPGGASIQFSGNSISKNDGEVYNGEVRIAAEWLNPAEASTLDRMPGNLQGVNELNQEVALATYGMMAIELMGNGGEALNIADGETATLSMPVPSALQDNVPSEIPLWSYYEPLGIWVKEGTASLVGNSYVGEVSHFSFWNCDAPFPLVEFEAQLVDAEGSPLVNHQVNIVTDISYTGSGYTDLQGFVSGLIPADVPLELQVLNICQEVVYSIPIGPFNADVNLGQLTVPPGTGVNTTVITGELTDCDGLPVEEGIVVAEFLGQTTYYYTDGSPFEFTLTSCSGLEEVVVTGIDLTDLVQSEPLVVNPNTQTELGQISVCDQQLQNYLLLVVDGVTAVYSDAQLIVSDSLAGSGDSTWTAIQAYGNNPGTNEHFIYIGFEGPAAAGDFSDANFIEVISDFNLGWQFQGGQFNNFTVTEFGGPGESVTGSFSGELQNSNGAVSDVSGSFDLLR